MGETETLQAKIARLTRERDEMAMQAGACAEEVDRFRVEIGTVQAENERLKSRLDFEVRAVKVAQVALAESERRRVDAEADRDALLGAIGFKPGPLGDSLRRKVILDDAGGLRGAMVKARREAANVQCDADLWTMRMLEEWPGDTLLLRLWRQRREAKADAAAARSRCEILARANADLAAGRVEDTNPHPGDPR